MNPVFLAALEVQRFCESQHWQFCFIGGVAVQRWGEPRLTKDADLTLMTGFGGEEPFIEALLSVFAPRRADAGQFALKSRVLLLRASSGIPLDIALGALPFEENSVRRASAFYINQIDNLTTCCAEDLIVHKAFASRNQDWLDIERILMRQAGTLNLDLIWTELRPLIALKESPEIEWKLKSMIDKWDK